jgi:2-phosphosulfolactate phosphatase
MTIPEKTLLVLPSPNGAELSLRAGLIPTITGCLRNAESVAKAAQGFGRRIAVIPAGERWLEDGSLRFAVEDWIGAGAIISFLEGRASPEAAAARTAFLQTCDRIPELLRSCGSGTELLERGFENDLQLASEFNVSDTVPMLKNGAYVRAGGSFENLNTRG